MIFPLVAALTLLAPPVSVPDVEGRSQVILGGGRPTVAFFVLQDCPIARQYAPEMARLAQDYRPRHVRFFLVVEDADATPSGVRTHLREYRLPFPGILDRGSLKRLAKASAVPTAAVFDARGNLRYSGRIDDRFPALGIQRTVRSHDLQAALDQLLGGKRVAPARTPVVGCALP